MKRAPVPAILLGLSVIVILVGMQRFGVFRALEHRSIDARYAASFRPPAPMTDEIVHIDIDDSAIDQFGKWPDSWKRADQAAVIRELALAGARTIALDQLFLLASTDSWHDEQLANALASTPCVLALLIRGGRELDEVWKTEIGEFEFHRLLAVIQSDILISDVDALNKASVTGERRDRFLANPREFRAIATWRAVNRFGDEAANFREFEKMIAPTITERTGTYPYQALARQAWEQWNAWRRIAPKLMPGGAGGAYNDQAPLIAFADAAGNAGFVSITQDEAQRAVRDLPAVRDSPGGIALQFGLAAAAAQLDIEIGEIEVARDSIRFGTTRLPLQDGRLWIHWPTSRVEPRWQGLLRQHEDDPQTSGHFSIREVRSLAEARETQKRMRAAFADVTVRILNYAGMDVSQEQELTRELIAAAADEVDFTLVDEPSTALEPVDADARAYIDHVHNCRTWAEVRDAIRSGDAKIEEVSATLREQVEGKLVFIGLTITGGTDVLPTAMGVQTPGVIVHAAIANMALNNYHARQTPEWLGLLVAIMLGIIGTFAAAHFSPIVSGVLFGSVLGGYIVVAGVWLFGWHDLLLPVVGPTITAGSSWIACTALEAALSQRARRRITRQFKARVSSQLVDYLTENPDSVTMTGEEREMTILFGDLAGFTAVSEQLSSQVTVATLNRYLGALTDVLVSKDAYVNKFLGDGLMAFWSAFTHDPDQAKKACAAAIECSRAIETLNHDPQNKGLPMLSLRIGVATGRVVVGDCGAPPALNDYTVIGDAVNLAARLESAGKQFGTCILIEGRTRELLGDSTLNIRPIGLVQVVGRSKPDQIYEVLPDDSPRELLEWCERLVREFAAKEFEEAELALSELERMRGSSKLVKLYRQAIAEAGEEFDGVLHLREK